MQIQPGQARLEISATYDRKIGTRAAQTGAANTGLVVIRVGKGGRATSIHLRLLTRSNETLRLRHLTSGGHRHQGFPSFWLCDFRRPEDPGLKHKPQVPPGRRVYGGLLPLLTDPPHRSRPRQRRREHEMLPRVGDGSGRAPDHNSLKVLTFQLACLKRNANATFHAGDCRQPAEEFAKWWSSRPSFLTRAVGSFKLLTAKRTSRMRSHPHQCCSKPTVDFRLRVVIEKFHQK